MKAALYRGPRDIQVEELPMPAIAAGEVLVRVVACGISGAVALQFPMRHPGVGTVVVGASNPREIEENVAAATFPVPDEIWAEVEERMRRRA